MQSIWFCDRTVLPQGRPPLTRLQEYVSRAFCMSGHGIPVAVSGSDVTPRHARACPPHPRLASDRKGVDGRDIGERSDAVLRTAMPGHDENRITCMIELHYWTTPNGHKITMFLEEAGLEEKIVPGHIGK